MEILRNPYLNRSMIKDPREFYGRKREITRIYSRLSASHPQCISIVGDRRIGKSSLLNYIYHEANRAKYLNPPDDFVFVFIDLQEERVGTLSDFFDHLFEFLNEALDGRFTVGEQPGYQGMRQLVARLEREHLKLIILFDEFDAITKNQNFDPEFFSFLRSIANRYDVAYILSSGSELQHLCHTKEIAESPFFNIFWNLRLGPLTHAEAQQLICEPSTAAGYNLQDYVDYLLDFAGHFPFFLQIASAAFFDYLLDYPDTDSPDLTEITDLFHQEADQHFSFLWEHLDSLHRTAIRTILEGSEIPPEQQDALMKLQRDGYVIEKDGKYRLFSSGFADYLNAQALHQPERMVASPEDVTPKDYRTEVIAVIDLCDSSGIANRYGANLLMEVLQVLREVIFPICREHNVQFLRSKGEDFLMTFLTRQDAIEVVMTVLKQIDAYNQTSTLEVPIGIHVGIHSGETRVGWENDRYGDAVNCAFRVASLQPNEMLEVDGGILKAELPLKDAIFITEHVHEEIKAIDEIRCQCIGLFKLKGIAERHMIYQVLCDE
ncbi:MAG: AAA family ATPase [Candidatus Poribacteria bacterium]|nr:AAA family ATPase [Candidatus Poribacteria bacterium]